MGLKVKFERGVFKPLDRVKNLKSGKIVEISLTRKPLKTYRFFGMWKNRKGINDSVRHVRKLRDWKR